MKEGSAKYVQPCLLYHAQAGHGQCGPAVYLPLLFPLPIRLHLAIKISVIIQLNLEYWVPPSHSKCETPFEGILLKLTIGSREEMAPKSPKYL